MRGADLQLAAELGKELLERNKVLEASLRHSKDVVEEQRLEITVSVAIFFLNIFKQTLKACVYKINYYTYSRKTIDFTK